MTMDDATRAELHRLFEGLSMKQQSELIAWCEALRMEALRQRLAAAVALRNRSAGVAGDN